MSKEKMDLQFTCKSRCGFRMKYPISCNGIKCDLLKEEMESTIAAKEQEIKELEKSETEEIKNRDEREDVINKLLGIFGIPSEWSNLYGFSEAIEAAEEKAFSSEQEIKELREKFDKAVSLLEAWIDPETILTGALKLDSQDYLAALTKEDGK